MRGSSGGGAAGAEQFEIVVHAFAGFCGDAENSHARADGFDAARRGGAIEVAGGGEVLSFAKRSNTRSISNFTPSSIWDVPIRFLP